MSGSGQRKLHRRPAIGRAGACLLLACTLSFAASLPARDHDRRREGRSADSEQHAGIGPARAAEIARNRYGGKVLKVRREDGAYRVKLLLDSGRVKSVWIDAGG